MSDRTNPASGVEGGVRHLPFDEALAIADSAVRRVLSHADGRTANPFESVLRALCLEAELDAQPQLAIDLGSGTVHPDLVVPSLRVALEADSWTFHATRGAHTRDCARYNLLVIHGWRVFRFT